MKIFNTLSGQKEEFVPQSNDIKMYVCGVTPYSDSHVGHAMSYIYFDVIRRYLKFRGYGVKYVQNLTDIDDKIIDRASRLAIPVGELAGKYIDAFFADMDSLNILRADVYPRATEEIPKMLEIIQSLVKNGYAYPAKGSVYFRVRSVPDYGKLSHRTLDMMEAGIRIEPGEEKEHPMDFVLWKASKPNEPFWPSPWGPGRPGWHIECSAMSVKYLGETIDIHGGGQDLIFPHHENETVQSESFTEKKPFVKYWMHNGLLRLGEEKMSKSLGNLVTIKEALKKYSADAVRIFILHSHYRTPLTYEEASLGASVVAFRAFSDAKWKDTEHYAEMNRSILEARGEKTDNVAPADTYSDRFVSAMDDDFNTPQALATLFDLAQEINRAVNLGHQDKIVEHRGIFNELAGVLGLVISKPETKELPLNVEDFVNFRELIIAKVHQVGLNRQFENIAAALKTPDIDSKTEVYACIQWLTDFRRDLRKAKQFQLADEIRTKLDELGIVLEDTPQETVWKSKR